VKTATLDAGGMSSMLDYRGVEKQLGRIPGVKQVTASIASNSATVEYDENVTNVAALKDKIEECGFHCAGRILPMHLCEPHSDHSATPAKQAGYEHHAHPMQAPAGKHAPMPMSHDMPYRDISWMQSRTALFRIGYTSHIASYTDRSLDNFGWAEHPADLAEIASPLAERRKSIVAPLESTVRQVFWIVSNGLKDIFWHKITG